MFKLNGEDAKQAWEDYKSFLEGMGGDLSIGSNPQRNHWVAEVERAFKFAFAAGKAARQDAITLPQNNQLVVMNKESQVEIVKRPVKRRTPEQIEQDAKLVSSILQRNGAPMYLGDIIKAVNAAGGDWYDRSASGHMIGIMEKIPAIKKLSRGLFEYQK
jgi:hypothetical protein